MIAPEAVILGSWFAFLLTWSISSLFVKRELRANRKTRLVYWLVRIGSIVLILVAVFFHTSTRLHLVSDGTGIPLFLHWVGAVATTLGVGFAIWARLHLGRNWSPRPAIKERHELITSGPYALVRHPIYTGILLALLGTTTTGNTLIVIILVLCTITFVRRIDTEERIMIHLFPEAYPSYRARTRRLVPWLW